MATLSSGQSMFRRSSARWLAPLALVSCAVVVYAVAMSGLRSGDGDRAPAKPAGDTPGEGSGSGESSRSTPATTSERPTGSGPRSYTVRPGDTLSAISAATGVPLREIRRLNPSLDSQSLQAGQRVKLAP